MTQIHLYLLLLAVVATVAGQSNDELPIPVENDNQFPPEKLSEADDRIIEGSGAGIIEEPILITTDLTPPLIEDVQLNSHTDIEQTESASEDTSCPKPCVCNIEGDSNNFVVDCSGYDLTQFPTNLDPKTTTLNLQNNKLTEIPKDVALLKNLKVLNANNNAIMELASGSISELPELTVLKLGNNRLIEYPKDLKNSFGLTKLEELDLGGNDMRTTFETENFSNFKALRILTLPSTTPELVEDLCRALQKSLETVCTGVCKTDQSFDCPDAPQDFEEGLLDAVIPGTIALSSAIEDNLDPLVDSADAEVNKEISEKSTKDELPLLSTTVVSEVSKDITSELGDSSIRSAVVKAPIDASQQNSVDETSKNGAVNSAPDVTVGATTSDTKTGGVDKSVIGMIVAGMVLVVAGITIKKNWSTIQNRFSSNTRAPVDRDRGANANGSAPEEVPLQEKSPV